MASADVVVLLRGVNVGGHRKLPMKELRTLAEHAGYDEPRTYIQSGNLIVRTDQAPSEVADTMRRAIEARFSFELAVLARAASTWATLPERCPFKHAWEARPRFVHVGFAGTAAPGEAQQRLQGWAHDDESVVVDGDVVWLDLARGASRTKITPARLDASFGTPVTCRNARSILKIAELLRL